jgi:hypothetical protein
MIVLPVVEGFSKNWSAVWHFAAILGNLNIFAPLEPSFVRMFRSKLFINSPHNSQRFPALIRAFTPDLWTNIWWAPPVAAAALKLRSVYVDIRFRGFCWRIQYLFYQCDDEMLFSTESDFETQALEAGVNVFFKPTRSQPFQISNPLFQISRRVGDLITGLLDVVIVLANETLRPINATFRV